MTHRISVKDWIPESLLNRCHQTPSFRELIQHHLLHLRFTNHDSHEFRDSNSNTARTIFEKTRALRIMINDPRITNSFPLGLSISTLQLLSFRRYATFLYPVLLITFGASVFIASDLGARSKRSFGTFSVSISRLEHFKDVWDKSRKGNRKR